MSGEQAIIVAGIIQSWVVGDSLTKTSRQPEARR
jgi:hypothetical protein